MSRSYKHTPVFKVGGKTKYAKQLANKKIRSSVKIILKKRIPVNPMIIVEKMNHGIFGIIDFGENQYGGRNLHGI